MTAADLAAAVQTVRALDNIILNGNQAEWITEKTAQAWLNELRVVEHHLGQAATVEAERDRLRQDIADARLTEQLLATTEAAAHTLLAELSDAKRELAEARQRLATATGTIDRIDRLVPLIPSDSSLIAAISLREILGTDHLEAHCVDSGHSIRSGTGDRCRAHGASEHPCVGGLRRPRCAHPDGSRNGSGRCDECGRTIEPSAPEESR